MEGLEPEPVLVTKYEQDLDIKMEGFERLLGKQKYMAGDVSYFPTCPPPTRGWHPHLGIANHAFIRL